jgi:hypothetical protein
MKTAAMALMLILVMLAGCTQTTPPTSDASSATMASATLPLEKTPIPSATPTLPAATPELTATLVSATSTPIPELSPTTPLPDTPYELVSSDSLFAYLTDLTTIQPYSGWRNSASSGEAEALDYVAGKLQGFANLQSLGLELERQSFPVYISTELRDSRLTLTVNQQPVEVPAAGLRGSRYDQALATYFDSDGFINDTHTDPVTATGVPLVMRDAETLYTLTDAELKDRILFLDFFLIDTFVNGDGRTNGQQVLALMDRGLAGVVLVTQYSDKPGESRGTVLGDGAIFQNAVPRARIPILHLRLEDAQPAGIATWEDLVYIETAQLMLDSDVFCPGQSGNVIARIPGADSSKAVILGAHIDSPNGPGAFDDGSGAAALLEVARVLDVAQIQPPVDVYLTWFGAHEIGLYGSANFVAAHQELLDRTLAMVQMDGLGQPLAGKIAQVTLGTTPYGNFGDERLPLSDFLAETVAVQGITLDKFVEYDLIADNSSFDAFNVPNVYLGYLNSVELQTKGSSYIHYASHWHDPYETVEHARAVSDAFVEMTQVLLAAALDIGRTQPDLRVPSPPQHRALFVANHTASVSVVPTMLRELGMALAWEGFDVDLIPYGQALTLADLENVDLIVLPPTLDYPGKDATQWTEPEFALLTDYVADGGFLIVVNSAYNYAMKRRLNEYNDDVRALNALLAPMGLTFIYGGSPNDAIAHAVTEHPLTANASYLAFYADNGVPMRLQTGLELIQAAGRPLVVLLEYGENNGQVLVIADLGIVQNDSRNAKNMEFLKNIAYYAHTR